jgi:hypothetical protein
MKKAFYIAFMCILLAFTSFSFGGTTANEQVKPLFFPNSSLTIDEIKKRYPENEIKEIRNIGEDYVLVESEIETFANRFDLYNLKTKKVDTLPTGFEYVTLEKIEGEDYFIFLATGKNSESPFKQFPYLINCFRVRHEGGMYNNFTAVNEEKYFDLNKALQAGSKAGSVMSDLDVTFDGIEVMFKPAEGMGNGFYADATDIPPTEISYDKGKNQMTIQIDTDKLGDSLKNGIISTDANQFISSYEIVKKDNKTNLILSLREAAKMYIARIDRLPNVNISDGFPVLKLQFKGAE